MSHPKPALGLAITPSMRTAISRGQWQSWRAVYWGSSAWHSRRVMNGENPCQLHTTHVGAVGWELYGSSTTTCARKADHGLVYVCPLLFKSLSFENSELNCSTAEVALKLFCVKLSGLISELKILEKSYLSRRIFIVRTHIWSLSKDSKTQKISRLIIFLSGMQ